jgi:hypothetical protein
MSTTKTEEKNHAIENAKGHLQSITELMDRYEKATSHEQQEHEDIQTEIYEYPLETAVRSGWQSLGTDDKLKPEEYKILLSTGGPALRIVGRLDRGQPESAKLQWQDWGTPWTEHRISGDEEDILIKFASVFYWGE